MFFEARTYSPQIIKTREALIEKLSRVQNECTGYFYKGLYVLNDSAEARSDLHQEWVVLSPDGAFMRSATTTLMSTEELAKFIDDIPGLSEPSPLANVEIATIVKPVTDCLLVGHIEIDGVGVVNDKDVNIQFQTDVLYETNFSMSFQSVRTNKTILAFCTIAPVTASQNEIEELAETWIVAR